MPEKVEPMRLVVQMHEVLLKYPVITIMTRNEYIDSATSSVTAERTQPQHKRDQHRRVI